MATDRAPVRPSREATNARQEAETSLRDANNRREEQAGKLDEVFEVNVRLADHRRANHFTELFQRALDRNK